MIYLILKKCFVCTDEGVHEFPPGMYSVSWLYIVISYLIDCHIWTSNYSTCWFNLMCSVSRGLAVHTLHSTLRPVQFSSHPHCFACLHRTSWSADSNPAHTRAAWADEVLLAAVDLAGTTGPGRARHPVAKLGWNWDSEGKFHLKRKALSPMTYGLGSYNLWVRALSHSIGAPTFRYRYTTTRSEQIQNIPRIKHLGP